MSPIACSWRGRLPYREALDAQRERREAVLEGRASEVLWALEHDPVITTGRRAAAGLPDKAALAARGIDLVETERGGLATWHGPGQLVLYAIIDAARRGLGARGLVTALEQGLIDWLSARDLPATRRPGFPGVWLPSPQSSCGLAKIAAVGLHFRRGVSIHGLALNLAPDLSAYALFVPCGITDAAVTSLAAHEAAPPSPEEAAPSVLRAVRARISLEGLDAPLSVQ